jgi:phenylacetyl-CoA:acceptor oxidoreductase subunit 2
MGSTIVMSLTLSSSGTPRLQSSWDSRAAGNFIGGGAGTGLLVAAAPALLAGRPYLPAGILAIALIGFGLSMVWLEIGRPLRALNVFFHPQTSWMSREALLALPLLAFAAAAVIADQNVVSLPPQLRQLAAPLALAAAVLAFAFLFCQARMLKASQGIPAWREPALEPVIVVTGLTEGIGLLLFLTVVTGPPPAWAVPAAIVALAARAGSWEYYRKRLNAHAPAPAIAAVNRVSIPIHALGHALPAALLVAAWFLPTAVALAAIAGLALAAAGAWLKFTVVTRAAYTQGLSIPFVPVRGARATTKVVM